MTRIERIGNCELHLGDCREILPTLGKVDAVKQPDLFIAPPEPKPVQQNLFEVPA